MCQKDDVISRQAAIERATKDHDFYKGATTPADMARRDELLNVMCWLGELPSAQPYTDEEIQKMQDIEQAQLYKAYEMGKVDAMRWIPISEKFPQKDEDVLLQFPSNQGVGYYEDGDWMINTGDGIYSIIGYNEEKPIAWMPLPEPYKGDDK